MQRFNIRVYGICINEQHEILLSDESYKGHSFTKFPGGGLEWGEGTRDCLKREFLEEFQLEIEVGELFYLTDFFQVSAFSENDQVVSVYYRISLPIDVIHHELIGDKGERLRWKALAELRETDVTFPIDKQVVQQILSRDV
jgi:8-oxo-dGTP diphosphatase